MTNPKKTTVKEARKTSSTKNRSTMLSATTDLAWTTLDEGRPRRWWWYASICVVGLYAAGLSALLGNWTFTAVIIVAIVGIFTIDRRYSEPFTYRLTKDGVSEGTVTYALASYRAFTLSEEYGRDGVSAGPVIFLLPAKRFRPALELGLTGDEQTNLEIVESLSTLLPLDEDESFGGAMRILSRMAKWLRIS
ncbi:hypothetical protein [Arthrobacter sp. CJ23]|uniref:hypothetical protein n=1 Tax=Arthrobacter sp. CJ23 TaxID=2972479 RepID=UPI00215BEF3C|nr:hypothetical protein [Arthrobacter sp. CJ23]UVJ38036.1 hypothetical protein NVV90_12270 [Arthrobacter sp. CJ23]